MELKPKHALLTSIWRFSPERKVPHPAPFPLALPIRAIYSIMDERKGVIIDPYCGSGTTLAAAKILGHDFIGIEMSDEYIKFADNRIKNYKAEIRSANEEMAKHIVEKTFKERKERGEFTGKHGKNSKLYKQNTVQPNLFSLGGYTTQEESQLAKPQEIVKEKKSRYLKQGKQNNKKTNKDKVAKFSKGKKKKFFK